MAKYLFCHSRSTQLVVPMKLAIMQPYLFPYLGYFQLLNVADTFVVLDDVNYINKGWINRNYFLLHGEKHRFTLPLKEASQNKKINEIEIADEIEKWRAKWLKTLCIAYKNAPYYATVLPILEEILFCEKRNLAAFLLFSLKKITDYMQIETEIVETSALYQNTHLTGEARILDICLQEKATDYLNPIGGKDLYHADFFAEKGINLHFLQMNPDAYLPVSIIDVLMHKSVAEIKTLLGQYNICDNLLSFV